MNRFKSIDNKKLLWDIIEEGTSLGDNKQSIIQLFNRNYDSFYNHESQICSSLMELNKKYIFFMQNQIAVYHDNQCKKKELVTFEDIQKDKSNQFDKDYQDKKNDFENSINVKPPPLPNFKIETEDTPLKETDKLIQEMIRTRNYEIDAVYKKNDKTVNTASADNNNTNKSSNSYKNVDNIINNVETPNKMYISINEEIDKSIIEKDVEVIDVGDKKHITWADDPHINNIYSKLKKKSPNVDLNSEISILHNKVDTLSIKIDAIMNIINQKFNS